MARRRGARALLLGLVGIGILLAAAGLFDRESWTDRQTDRQTDRERERERETERACVKMTTV